MDESHLANIMKKYIWLFGECSPLEMNKIYHLLMNKLLINYEYIVNVSKGDKKSGRFVVNFAQYIYMNICDQAYIEFYHDKW